MKMSHYVELDTCFKTKEKRYMYMYPCLFLARSKISMYDPQ